MFEREYMRLVSRILVAGYNQKGRNGWTKSLLGLTLTFSLYENNFPILQSRQYFYKGVLGELAALLNRPKSLEDFTRFGCNYWQKWCNKDLSINVDYGNAWFDFNGVNQLEWLINEIKTNPTSRRLILTSWVPDNVINNKLNLPCCHYTYQFIVQDNVLNMIWIQRSADFMIGVPADAVLAATFLIALANEVMLEPGQVVMQFGDCHIYEEHLEQAADLVQLFCDNEKLIEDNPTKFRFHPQPGTPLVNFVPSDLVLDNYKSVGPKVDFLLKE